MKRSRVLLIVGTVLLSLAVHGWTVPRLPVDADEPGYLQVAREYAAAMRDGDINAIAEYPNNREHPALAKLLYALSLLPLPPEAQPIDELRTTRGVSALLGTEAVLILALVDPLAGLIMAMQLLFVKYTSLVYLEALPFSAMLAAVLTIRRSVGRDHWFWISATALGAMTAGKLSYAPIVVVILYIAIVEKHHGWVSLLAYFVASAAVSVGLNPYLWHQPDRWLVDAINFHGTYSQGAHVQSYHYAWYQSLIWLASQELQRGDPETFFWSADGLIVALATLGLVWEWRQRPWVAIWLATGLLTLFLWPTKWPHYTLLIVPPVCLAAATGARRLAVWARSAARATT